jgi:hypothetical protein
VTSTKKTVINNLVYSDSVVRLYVDPRPVAVIVPEIFKANEWLCLDIGLPGVLPRPIHDLMIGEQCVQGTLSFGGTPYYCSVPYTAIHGARHMTSGGLVSWSSGASAAAQRDTSPPTERLPPKTDAKVIDLAAWRRAHGR